jgi:hypothetical protein
MCVCAHVKHESGLRNIGSDQLQYHLGTENFKFPHAKGLQADIKLGVIGCCVGIGDFVIPWYCGAGGHI